MYVCMHGLGATPSDTMVTPDSAPRNCSWQTQRYLKGYVRDGTQVLPGWAACKPNND